MKKVGYYLISAIVFLSCSEDAEDNGNENATNSNNEEVREVRVSIPDAAFEQALVDLNFDDVVDGEVSKNRIDFVTELIINDKGISDLTGIAEFDDLVNLNVRDNELISLDVSRNNGLLFVWAEGNQLESINVTGLSSLEKLGLDRNNLEEVSVGTNESLQLLTLSENQLLAIDVSNNNDQTDFTVVDNPLNSILVNQTQLDAIPTDWVKDETDSYSLDCE